MVSNRSSSQQQYTILIGDGGGTIVSYDLRKLSDFHSYIIQSPEGGSTTTASTTRHNQSLSNSAVTGRFVGPAGSVQQLTTLSYNSRRSSNGSKSSHHFACVGYDRMLRVYDVSSRKQLHMVYLKQRLNSVLMLPSDTNDNDDDDGDDFQPNHYSEHDLDLEDQVRDYVMDSDADSYESDNEDDIVDEMMDALVEDDNDGDDNSDDNDDDDDDEEEEDAVPQEPARKRNRQ
jgi:hypothetical protein